MSLTPSQIDVLRALGEGPLDRRSLGSVLPHRDDRTIRRAIKALGAFVARDGWVFAITEGGRNALAAHGRPMGRPGQMPTSLARASSAEPLSEEVESAAQQQQIESEGVGAPMGGAHGRIRFVVEGDPLLVAEFFARHRGDVSRGNGGIVHRDLKPENVLVEDLTDDERVAVAERFAQFKDAGEPVRNVARMTELVVADCRRSPAILSGYIEASKERAERARRAQEDRDRIAKQKADDERAAKALLDSMPRSPKRP